MYIYTRKTEPYIYIYTRIIRKKGTIYIYIAVNKRKLPFCFRFNFRVYIFIHTENGSQASFRNTLTVCSWYKRKFVVCPFVGAGYGGENFRSRSSRMVRIPPNRIPKTAVTRIMKNLTYGIFPFTVTGNVIISQIF
jgi:hypothetical protein